MTDKDVHYSGVGRSDRLPRSAHERRGRRLAATIGATLAVAALAVTPVLPARAADDTVWPGQTYPGDPAGEGPYSASWESVDQHTASPEWFKDAKFGVYWHWGAFSVPATYNEWYGRLMYIDNGLIDYHKNTFGDQFDTSASGFGYEKFIDGGYDEAGNYVQFNPKLTSQGGQFDPEAWVDMVADSGAQFAGPVAEHHDGFSMWDSQVNEWNSVDKGPNLDLLKIWSDEIREHDMKMLVAMHHAFHVGGFFGGAPQMPDGDSRLKLYGQQPRDERNQLWYDKLREVMDQSQPDIIWQDFGLAEDNPNCSVYLGRPRCEIDESQRLNFLSYYFNQGEELGKDVVTTYKHFDSGMNDMGEVADYERGGPADVTYPYWLTDDSISDSSWSWTSTMGYYSSTQMIHALLDRVSKNGNMLLNIAPKADGSIPQEQKDLLHGMGEYLKRNGEAVYSTRAWDVYGEGPTKMGGGSFVTPVAGTAQDIRYTVSKDDKKLYATVLGWPGDNANVALSTLAGGKVDLSGLAGVKLFGASAGDRIDLNWSQNQTALRVQFPDSAPVADAAGYVIELDFPGGVPTVNGDNRASFYASETGDGSGISVPVSEQEGRILKERGVEGSAIASMRLGKDVRVTTYASSDMTGEPNATYQSASGGVITPTAPIGSLKVESVAVGTYNVMGNINRLKWDATGASDGSGVVQKTSDGSDGQDWRFEPTSDGYYRLVNPATNLAITSPSSQVGAQLVLKTRDESDPAQEWLKSDADSNSLFTNRANPTMVIDSGGNYVSSGGPLKQWDNNGSGNFRFTVTELSVPPEGEVRIAADQNGLQWDTNGATTSGSGVVQNSSSASLDQSWSFQATSDGYYRIVSESTGRAVESPSSEEGVQLLLKDVSDSSAQEWMPVKRDGFWIFQNRAHTAMVIDSGGGVPSGSPLKQWGDDGSANFRFTVQAVLPQVDISIETEAERAYGTAGTATVTVTGTDSVPGGEVILTADGDHVDAGTLDGSGSVSFAVPGEALAVGVHQLRAQYVPQEGSAYGEAITSLRVTITEATSPSPTPTPTPSDTPTGTPTASPSPSASPSASPSGSSSRASAPSESDLTDAARGGVTAPATVDAGASISVTVGADRVGQTVNAWLFSQPTTLGSAVVDTNGQIRVTIPAATPAGTHRLAVTDAAGTLIGWQQIEVRRSGAALAFTGSEVPLWASVLGAGFVAVGAWALRRRRTTTTTS